MKFRILVLFVLAAVILCSCNLNVQVENTQPTPEHTHIYEDTYTNDATHHWYECECGAKDSYEEHVWNNGVITIIPTPDSDGFKTYTCMECGRKKSEKVVYDENGGNQGGGDIGGGDVGGGDVELNGLSFAQEISLKMDDHLPCAPLSIETTIYVDPNFTGRVGAIFGNYLGLEMEEECLFEIFENGVPRFYYIDAGRNIKDIKFTEVDVRTGDWAHIALTFDFANKKISLYLNGELAQSIALTSDLCEEVTTYRYFLGSDGRSNNGNYFKGQIKSIAVYSDVRTASEIAETAKNGINSNADGILLHYELNENSAQEDILDLSPNGYKISKEWLDSNVVDLDYAYSFAVIGDTQWLSKYMPAKMEGIYDWIVDNAESKKIAHVMGLGDITEDWNTAGKEQEWIRAHEYISKLNGVVPYSLVRGNHDESKYFLKYFADEVYMDQFGGYYMVEGDIRNAYKTFRAGSVDYLLMVLDFGPSDEILEWANEVVLAHPNHRVIVTTHGYQAFDAEPISPTNVNQWGGTSAANDVDTSAGGDARGYNNGEQLWDKFLSNHPNIVMLICGHTSSEDVLVRQTEGKHGNIVNQMLIDPQWMDPSKGGVGMVCMLYFSEDGTQMEVEWLSTDTGKYYQEHNQFQLDLSDSLNGTPHVFEDAYNEKTHHKACACGYMYDEEAHVFDGGVLNADGFMVYSCECGYQRIASATNDPVALELQALLEKYYNNGVYYKSYIIGTGSLNDVFYNAEKFWNAEGTQLGTVSGTLTLRDIILGKYGDLKLDLGWNYNDGVYTSVNENTVSGIKLFAAPEAENVAKVTVEELHNHVVIKLWSGDAVAALCEVGMYATTNLVNHAGDDLGTIYTKSNENGMCEVTAPTISGYVAEYDYFILSTIHDELTRTVYYSTVDVWDGKTVSTSLQGSGTQEDPFLITSGADLAYIAKIVNEAAERTPNFSGKYFKLTQSIDINGHDLYIGSFSAWATRKGFYGFLDGNHCTIRGIDQNRSLFGTIEGGSLTNLSVYGKVSSSPDEATGGIVAYVTSGGVLENLTSYVTINCTKTIGGVVGNAENQASTVKNCVNYGNVTGSSWNIGGIAGSAGHDIIDCVNYGKVHSTGSDNIGGIAGSTKNTGKISGCFNYGKISSAYGRVGGIAGWSNTLVTGCVNYGTITSSWDCGGIVGYVNDGQSASIVNCVNNGYVESTTGVGGIFGFNHANAGTIIITGCVNNGTIVGTWGVGGIAGNTKAEISYCVNNGTLNAKGELGGIVGRCLGKVTECTNIGYVKGTQDIIGGIVGHLFDETQSDIINTTNYQNGTVEGPNAKDFIAKIN